MRIYCFLTLAVLTLAGCIPFGDPPVGNVVTNEIKIPASRAAMQEQMVAELTAVIMNNAYGEKFMLQSDRASAADLYAAFNGCALFTGVTQAEEAGWQLISVQDNGKWCVTVRHNGTIIRKIVLTLPETAQ